MSYKMSEERAEAVRKDVPNKKSKKPKKSFKEMSSREYEAYSRESGI